MGWPGNAVTSSIWSHESGPPQAPLIVLVHGAMDRSAGMLKLSRQLAGSYRVVRYDRRGYGRSKPHAGPFTMGAQVDDLAAVLDGRRAVVFGHSYGGNVALALAERNPELVRAVVVYEVPLSWLPWWPGSSGRTTETKAENEHGRAADAAERFMRRMVGDGRWESLSDRVRNERRSEGLAFVEEFTDLARCPPWQAELIDVPFAAIYGELARERHRDGSHYLAELLSDRDAVAIPDAKHNGPFTHPERVAAIVRALEADAPA